MNHTTTNNENRSEEATPDVDMDIALVDKKELSDEELEKILQSYDESVEQGTLDDFYYSTDLRTFHCLAYSDQYFYVTREIWNDSKERYLRTLSPVWYENVTFPTITVLAEVMRVDKREARNNRDMIIIQLKDFTGPTSTLEFHNPEPDRCSQVTMDGDETVFHARMDDGTKVEIKKGAVVLLRSKASLSMKDAHAPALDGTKITSDRTYINLETVESMSSENVVEHVETMLRQYLLTREKQVLRKDEIEGFVKISRKPSIMNHFSTYIQHFLVSDLLHLPDGACEHYGSISQPHRRYYEALLMCFVMEHWLHGIYFEDQSKKKWIDIIRPKITCEHAKIICQLYRSSSSLEHQLVYNCSCCPHKFLTDLASSSDAPISTRLRASSSPPASFSP